MILRDIYQFPAPLRPEYSVGRQWWRLLAHVVKIGMALLYGNPQQAASETWAAKRSGEAMHRILSGRGFVIMGLYLLNACRWACERKWSDVCYWLSALAITATVTFGYKH